jgi:hypothetical protein
MEQALNNAMDEIEAKVTVYSAAITASPVGKPENADEIAAKV